MAFQGEVSYSAGDAENALLRLSNIVAEKGLNLQDGLDVSQGAYAMTQEELQLRWQQIASVAGHPLSPEALEHLRTIYYYIEAVIVACGTPDAFDVYEVCFESLVKVGSVAGGAASTEILTNVLEDIHEVYDVLLSCVETYEWVQPGATGVLRLYMLEVVGVCFGHARMTGRNLMELTDNDVSGAMSLVSFVLRCPNAPFEMQAAAGRCLVELTTADSVFLKALEDPSGAGLDGQNQQIAKLTLMLNKHVNGLIKGIIQFDLVEAMGRCICQHQMSHLRTDIIVKSFLTTIHNCLLYCSENQKKFRQHLATQSTVVQDIMIPYVHNILPALYDNPSCGPHAMEWQNLKAALETFVVVTFNINVFRPQLCQADMLPRICQVPNILKHISMLELIVKIAINVDFTRSPYYNEILALLRSGFDGLTPDGQERLRRRCSPQMTGRLPYAKSSVRATEELAFFLPQSTAGVTPAAKHSGKMKKKFFGQQAPEGYQALGGGDDSDDDDMPPLIPVTQLPAGSTSGQASIPAAALCELTGALMLDPMYTPDGHIFERAALEDWMTISATDPATGAPLQIGQCQPHAQLQILIQGYQMQMFATSFLSPEAFDLPPTMDDIAAPRSECFPPMLEAPPAQAPTGGYLSDLPALGPTAQVTSPTGSKKKKPKIHIASRSVVDAPEDMRCMIDGKVLINPVRSPYGHFFEKKTLEKWFGNCGSVCPVTGQPLRLEECVADADMKKRVVKFLKGEGA